MVGKYGLESDDENGVIPESAYIGDDIPDLPAMRRCKYICCPADAVEEIKKEVYYISENIAGNDAISSGPESFLTSRLRFMRLSEWHYQPRHVNPRIQDRWGK